MSLGSSSKVKSFFPLSIFNGVLFSAAYIIMLSKKDIVDIQMYSYISISIFAILHGAERYIRHVVDDDSFLDLWYGKEDIENTRRKIEQLEEEKMKLKEEREAIGKEQIECARKEGGMQKANSYNNKIKKIETDMKEKDDKIEEKREAKKRMSMSNKIC